MWGEGMGGRGEKRRWRTKKKQKKTRKEIKIGLTGLFEILMMIMMDGKMRVSKITCRIVPPRLENYR